MLTTRTLTTAAWTAAAMTTTLSMGCLVFEVLRSGANIAASADPEAGTGGVVLVAIQSVVESAFAVLGGLVVSRQPRNPVGWLLIVIGVSFTCIAVSNQLYVHWVLPTGDLSGISTLGVWLGSWVWIPAMVPAFTLLPLLFPTGRPLTRRWRPLIWYVVVVATLAALGTAFVPGPLGGAPAVVNPLGVDVPGLELVGQAALIGLLPAALACIASLVVRFRRSRGTERQQLKWVASSAMLLPAAWTGLGLDEDASWPLILCALLVIAVAVSVAMLRYRLYDIDLVINKSLVFVVLAGFITAVYAAV
ncbi:MAG: hypothetical protein M3313_06565, partial [Actinomycetota bacterium]|nr:hypothetical protein [Actinomycetota bacterium]